MAGPGDGHGTCIDVWKLAWGSANIMLLRGKTAGRRQLLHPRPRRRCYLKGRHSSVAQCHEDVMGLTVYGSKMRYGHQTFLTLKASQPGQGVLSPCFTSRGGDWINSCISGCIVETEKKKSYCRYPVSTIVHRPSNQKQTIQLGIVLWVLAIVRTFPALVPLFVTLLCPIPASLRP